MADIILTSNEVSAIDNKLDNINMSAVFGGSKVIKKVGKYQKLMFEKHGIILFLIDNFGVSMLQCVMPLQTPFKWVFLRHRGTPSPTPGNSAFPGAGKQKNALPI